MRDNISFSFSAKVCYINLNVQEAYIILFFPFDVVRFIHVYEQIHEKKIIRRINRMMLKIEPRERELVNFPAIVKITFNTHIMLRCVYNMLEVPTHLFLFRGRDDGASSLECIRYIPNSKHQ